MTVPFYGKTHTKETLKKMSENISKSMKGKRPKNLDVLNRSLWWNNGIINKRTIERPGENWERGQLR